MENYENYAKTKEVRTRDSQPNAEDDGSRLARFGGSRSIDGLEQPDGFTGGDCQEDDSCGSTDSSRAGINFGIDVGKILEEVLLLKQQFLDYVQSHQSRLEARLDESKKREQQFLANAEALEKKLKTAITIQREPSDNS